MFGNKTNEVSQMNFIRLNLRDTVSHKSFRDLRCNLT